MSRISRIDGTRSRELLPELLIGRSSLCGLRLDAADVSKEHAVIRWTGSNWELRDLGSRNGTFCQGRQLDAGESVILEPRVEIHFGGEELWQIETLSAPQLRASTIDAGEPASVAGSQLLSFGEDEALLASVYRDADQRWVIERDGELAPVENLSQVEVGGRRWELSLPDPVDVTAEPGARAFIRRAKLVFTAGPDQPVKIIAHFDDGELDLRGRGYHHLTLALAKRRLADQRRGVPDADQGWVGYRELQTQLDYSRNNVNVNVHRARRQLENAGFADAASIVERRLTTGKLRIGVAALEIHE